MAAAAVTPTASATDRVPAETVPREGEETAKGSGPGFIARLVAAIGSILHPRPESNGEQADEMPGGGVPEYDVDKAGHSETMTVETVLDPGTAAAAVPSAVTAPTEVAEESFVRQCDAGEQFVPSPLPETRRRRRKTSAVRRLIGMAISGAIGIALGYLILCWIGGKQYDFLNIFSKTRPSSQAPLSVPRPNVSKKGPGPASKGKDVQEPSGAPAATNGAPPETKPAGNAQSPQAQP